MSTSKYPKESLERRKSPVFPDIGGVLQPGRMISNDELVARIYTHGLGFVAGSGAFRGEIIGEVQLRTWAKFSINAARILVEEFNAAEAPPVTPKEK